MTTTRSLAQSLADAFLADGAWTDQAMAERAGRCLNARPRPRWVRKVAREVLTHHPRPPLDRRRELAALVAVLIADVYPRPGVVRPALPRPAMGRARWPVPPLETFAHLAAFLGLDHGQLAWLTDPRGLERRAPDERLRNYGYDWRPRGTGPPRPIERPKARLKAAQRRVLHEILDRIPAHDAAHGFTRGRSAGSHAAAHTGRRVVLRFDLEDFFAAVPAGRVYGVFRTAGYPEDVAHALTALSTNTLPAEVWATAPRRGRRLHDIAAHHRLGRRLATPHLPQGAPTSPALANLCALGLDRRLTGLAAALDARYTRYADDLVLSGDGPLLRRAQAARRGVGAIAADEGFALHEAKSRLMTAAGRQTVCGVVVNAHPNVPRREYDELKAILHNAARTGPEPQNRGGVANFQAHLRGRIAWVESLNAGRGAQLRRRYERVEW